MLDDDQIRHFHDVGYIVVEPGLIDEDAFDEALDALHTLVPSPEQVAGRSAPGQFGDLLEGQFSGLFDFPLSSNALNLLSVAPGLLSAVGQLLADDAVLYQACLWAKYSGGASYDQPLHLDYRNQNILVPSAEAAYRQLNAFIYLSDVAEDTGATRLVPRHATGDLPTNVTELDRHAYESVYAHEVPATGLAGSVLFFEARTYHRAVDMTRPEAARFVVTTAFRPRDAQWIGYHSWPFHAKSVEWTEWVGACGGRQLQALGFPGPGNSYWTPDTIAAVQERYPGIDLAGWQAR